MDSERVNEIRAALDEYDALGEKSFYEISDHDNIRARNIRDDMPTWLRDLLTELGKLQAAIEAVRPLVNAERKQLSREQLAAWEGER